MTMKADDVSLASQEKPASSKHKTPLLSLDDLDQLDGEMAFADYLPMLENLEEELNTLDIGTTNESSCILSFDDAQDRDLDLGIDLDLSELQSLDNLEEFGDSYSILYRTAAGNGHCPSHLDIERIINKIVDDALPKLERELRIQLMRTMRKQVAAIKS